MMAKSYELFFLFHTKGHMMTISIFMDDICCKCSIFMNSLQSLHLGFCQHKETLNICAGLYLHHHHPYYLKTSTSSTSQHHRHHHLHHDHHLYHRTPSYPSGITLCMNIEQPPKCKRMLSVSIQAVFFTLTPTPLSNYVQRP